MGYRFKGNEIIISGIKQRIVPGPLPSSPTDGLYAIDLSDNKFKVYNETKGRWIILGDAEDVVFDNSSNNFDSNSTQDAIEEARDTLIGKVFNATFFSDGIVFGTDYLSYGDNLATSDEVPYVMPYDCKLVAITYTNEDRNTDSTIRVRASDYNSGNSDSIRYSTSFTNIRTGSFTDINNVNFNAGDKVAVTVSDNGTNPDEPKVTLYFQITDNTLQNLTENWSGDF